ncbi:MAG TPA: GTP pyrophosphokinase [Ornithinimicrobium sp.]|nr:GTP pyrophosphokinase [Ornithinimicrobium sp.]
MSGGPDPQDLRAAVDAYVAHLPELEVATEGFVRLVTDLLDDAGVNYLSVSGRTKSVQSFAAKAGRTRDGRPVFPRPLAEITDQIGLRVITYVRDDVEIVAELLASTLAVLEDRDMGRETADQGAFGYASRHLLVAVDASRSLTPARELLRPYAASVQVRTVLQHAWAEFEHDIRYKGTVPVEHASDLNRRFTLAAGLLELADREFSAIRDRLQAMPAVAVEPDGNDPRIGAQDLATFLAGRFPGAGWSRTEHYGWISGLLLELGITSLDELGAQLSGVDTAAVNETMGYRYPPAAVRRLDDALLSLHGAAYLELHGNAHRAEQLRERLATLRAGSADAGEGGSS